MANGRGASTDPPTLYAPPPAPPPYPSPTPGPAPLPTPPPEPDPIPPPDPVPLEAAMVGRAAVAGTPRFGAEAAIWICGGATIVGSAASFGCSLRTRITGGVICCSATRGILPRGAWSLSRSPPPPPPPACLVANGNA